MNCIKLNKVQVVFGNMAASLAVILIQTLLFSTLLYQISFSLPVEYQENTINSDPNILVRDETSSENKDAKVCVTKECMAITASIKANIDEDIKPCDDFYDYACGQWIKDNPIPKGKLQISAFTELRDKNNEIMREALVKDDALNDLLPIKKVRTFFQSCLNVNAIDKLGSQPIKEYIKDLDSWAVDNSTGWKSEKWDVFKTLKKIQKKYTSTNLFFTVESVPDPLRKGVDGKNILMVSQSIFSINCSLVHRELRLFEWSQLINSHDRCLYFHSITKIQALAVSLQVGFVMNGRDFTLFGIWSYMSFVITN